MCPNASADTWNRGCLSSGEGWSVYVLTMADCWFCPLAFCNYISLTVISRQAWQIVVTCPAILQQWCHADLETFKAQLFWRREVLFYWVFQKVSGTWAFHRCSLSLLAVDEGDLVLAVFRCFLRKASQCLLWSFLIWREQNSWRVTEMQQ